MASNRFLLSCLVFLSLISWVTAQTETVNPPVDKGLIETEIRRVETDSTLSDEVRAQTLEVYQKALSAFSTARDFNAAANNFRDLVQEGPSRLEQLRTAASDEAEGISADEDELDFSQLGLQELSALQLSEQAEIVRLQNNLLELERRLRELFTGPTRVRQRLAQAQREYDSLLSGADGEPRLEEPEILSLARQRFLELRIYAYSAEIAMLNQEILAQPVEAELLEIERDQTFRKVETLRIRLQALQDAANQIRLAEARELEASTEREKSQRLSEGRHPVLTDLAERNAELGGEILEAARELESVTAAAAVAAEEAKELEADFASTRQKIEVAGLSQALSRALAERQRTLPNSAFLQRQARDRQQLIEQYSLKLIRNRDERRLLHSVERAVDRLLSEVDPQDHEDLRIDATALISTRIDLLDRAIASQATCLSALAEFEFHNSLKIGTVKEFETFLGERLLWVRSNSPIGLSELKLLPDQLLSLLSVRSWFGVVKSLTSDLTRISLTLLLLFLTIVLFSKRGWIFQQLRAEDQKTSKGSMLSTWRALAFTVLAALPLPLATSGLGYLLRGDPEAEMFSQSVGIALITVSVQVLFLELFRSLCHPSGLGETYFKWKKESLSLLRKVIVRLELVFIPASILTVILFHHYHFGVGAMLSFVTAELALAWALYRILSPKGLIFKDFIRHRRTSFFIRLWPLWMTIAVIIPIVLALLVLLGYVNTSGVFVNRFIYSLWFILGLVVAREMAIRWLLLTHRRLSRVGTGFRQGSGDVSVSQENANGAQTSEISLEADTRETALESLNFRTHQLLKFALTAASIGGFYLIWSPVIPALGILDRVELWQQTVTVGTGQVIESVSLEDALLALIIGLASALLAKNLPTLVEVGFLERSGMDTGSRYAVTTLVAYSVAAVGAIWGFSLLGIHWSQIQWLIAALGVGIGFGLQEIVANFISGLIILFERPIRIGDVVTIGDTDGVVTRIRIRATTIQNWDKKELLVPNKEFITGRLLNWSLSDEINRITIRVGISYACDVEQALKILEETARGQEHILDDPPPRVIFENFGASSLDLVLHCYLSSLEHRLATITDLHRLILRRFREAGLSIPFQQHDVHLDSDKPLAVRVVESQPQE